MGTLRQTTSRAAAHRVAARRLAIAGCAAVVALAACTGQSADQQVGASPANGAISAASTPVPLSGPAEIDRRVSLIAGASQRYRDLIRSFVVRLDGAVVAEHYGANGGPDVTSNIYSVTKSVTSMLIGIAISDGSIPGVDSTVGQLLPGYLPVMAPGMADVTVRQLLTMTGGVIADDHIADAPDTDDWVADVLSTPLQPPTASGFAYSSSGYHLLSAILTTATGRSALDYARDKLFDPLGISTEPASQPVAVVDPVTSWDLAPGFGWPVDPKGIQLGYSDLKLTATDMAKLGQLYLDQGRWQGGQIVPADWVAESTGPVVDPGFDGYRYGYGWWITTSAGHPAFAGLGDGGQVLQVVPDLGMVVVIAAKNGAGAFDEIDLLDIVEKQIVPIVSN
ncbi:MAG: serine hydrolase [Nakamurella sp.]